MAQLSAAQCLDLIQQAHQCAAAPAAVVVANPDQPKFDALAASFGGLATAVTIGAIVIGVMTIVITGLLTFIGYQWAKVVVREAKEDAKLEAATAIADFIKYEAPKLIRDGSAHLQSGGSDLNATPGDASDKIAEASG